MNRPIVLSIALLTALLAASGISVAQPSAGELKKVGWKVGETDRHALVWLPAAKDQPGKDPPGKDAKRPVVFAFHGHGGKAEFSSRKFAFHTLWPEAIVVYPQGLPTPTVIDPDGKKSGWQKYVGDQDDRDLAFFDAILKSLKADHPVDEKRIYSAGHSNGGYFTYVLAAARGDTFAAIAPVAAAVSERDFKNQKPLPVLHVAGEKDFIVPFKTQERTMSRLRTLNGADAEGKAAGKWCTEYTSAAGPPVVLFIHPGNHGIPDGATERIVQFFKEQAKK